MTVTNAAGIVYNRGPCAKSRTFSGPGGLNGPSARRHVLNDALGLEAGEKSHHVLVDERRVPQVQDQLLTRCLEGEPLLLPAKP